MTSRTQHLTDRMPDQGEHGESLALKYAGNGSYHAPVMLLLDLLCEEVRQVGIHLAFEPDMLRVLETAHQADRPLFLATLARLKVQGVPTFELERAVEALPPVVRSTAPLPQASTALMAQHFDPPVFYVEGFLPHGMTILAGKRKKGKSTFALELALSIAVGRAAMGKLATRQSKVLYISLEDNDFLINRRLKDIQADFIGHPNLHFLYSFVPLDDPQALAWLTDYIAADYRVIVIDVLGRVLPSGQTVRKHTDDYKEMTALLGPLQLLANQSRSALVLLDHVRKAEADDPFDTIHGTGAKTGVADNLIVYERRFKEKEATLHMSSRLMGDETMKITLVDGHLEFLGMGDDFELNQEEHRVSKIIQEENRPMAVRDLMQALGIPLGQYPRFRVAINRMYHKGILGKTKRGLYTVGTIRQDDDDDLPVPF